MDKFQKFITKDLGWKLLSIAIASIMWFLVININQPIDTRTYYKKVSLENIHILTNEGLTIAEVQDVLDTTVSIKIKSQRTALDRLANDLNNLTATIDLSALQTVSAGETVSLPIEISFTDDVIESTYTVLSQSPSNLSIKIDDVVEEQRNIEVEISGVVQEDGMLSNPQLSDEIAMVKGASSAVEKVEKVYGVIDGGAVSKDGYERITLKGVTADGDIVENIQISPESILVSFYEIATKNIPIYINVTGKPSSSFLQGNVVVKPEYITVIGEVQLVEALNSIQLENISISGATSSISKMYNIKDYLPEGVYLSTGQSQYINVVVPLLGNEVREIQVNSEQIEIKGKNSELIYFIEEYATANIEGEKSSLDNFDNSTIKGSIDVEELLAGEYTLDIEFIKPQTLSSVTGYISILIENNSITNNSESSEESDYQNDLSEENTSDNIVNPTESNTNNNADSNSDVPENNLENNVESNTNSTTENNSNSDTVVEDTENQSSDNLDDADAEPILPLPNNDLPPTLEDEIIVDTLIESDNLLEDSKDEDDLNDVNTEINEDINNNTDNTETNSTSDENNIENTDINTSN